MGGPERLEPGFECNPKFYRARLPCRTSPAAGFN